MSADSSKPILLPPPQQLPPQDKLGCSTALFRIHTPTCRGVTLLEVFVALTVVAILVALVFTAVSSMPGRAKRVQCTANLRNLYIAAEEYVQQNGSWPQINTSDSDTEEQEYAAAWIAALKPFGPTEKTWICPTIQQLLRNPDYTKPENIRVDYVATAFDDKPTSPHEWARQPWFIETGNVHGNGNLIIFTDGSINDLNTIVNNQATK